MWKTWVWSLGWEDPLEEGMATHSSVLAWRIPMERGTWQATVCGAAKSRTQLSFKAQLSTAYAVIRCQDAAKHSTNAQESSLPQTIIWPSTWIVMMGEKLWPGMTEWKVVLRTIPYPMPSFPMGCKALTTKCMPSRQGTGRVFHGAAYPPERKDLRRMILE